MLNVINSVPEGLLELEAPRLHEVLPGPTLMHLSGRRPQPLFVSVLLHGNEDTGWLAVRELLRKYQDKKLPRALSVFVGNVLAARLRERFLPGQPDYNRIWETNADRQPLPEHKMVRQVVEEMRVHRVFASIDIHNTSGMNPHYASVRRIDHRFLHLATLFGRTVVYFVKPDGVQVAAFSELCPAVTVECGRPGESRGVEHALEYLEAGLHLAEIPNHPVATHDIDLFHTVAIVKVPSETSFGFGDDSLDIRLVDDLDTLNFRELPIETTFGWIRPDCKAYLDVRDERGHDVTNQFFGLAEREIRTAKSVIPAMLTLSAQAIRQDCLCYLMERYQDYYEATVGHLSASGNGRS
ncbi:MAG: M14 family metallopeptidase [Acidiferrobacterales bacterium]